MRGERFFGNNPFIIGTKVAGGNDWGMPEDIKMARLSAGRCMDSRAVFSYRARKLSICSLLL